MDDHRRYTPSVSVRPLTPEQEAPAFLAYCVFEGDIVKVAGHTGHAASILQSTAMFYKWDDKRAEQFADHAAVVAAVQKDIANTLLLATLDRVKKTPELLMPRKATELNALIDLVTKLNSKPEAAPTPAGTTTVVHAANVQINQGSQGALPAATPEETRVRLLKEMAGK